MPCLVSMILKDAGMSTCQYMRNLVLQPNVRWIWAKILSLIGYRSLYVKRCFLSFKFSQAFLFCYHNCCKRSCILLYTVHLVLFFYPAVHDCIPIEWWSFFFFGCWEPHIYSLYLQWTFSHKLILSKWRAFENNS